MAILVSLRKQWALIPAVEKYQRWQSASDHLVFFDLPRYRLHHLVELTGRAAGKAVAAEFAQVTWRFGQESKIA